MTGLHAPGGEAGGRRGAGPDADAGAPRTIVAALAAAARQDPGAPAVFVPRGRSGRGAAGWSVRTNAELWARTRSVAAAVTAAGLRPHDRAVVLVPPDDDFFALTLGLLHAGVVPVLVDPGIGRRHLRTCLDEADAAAFLGTVRAHAARVALGLARSAHLHVVVGPRRAGPVGGRTPFGTMLRALEDRAGGDRTMGAAANRSGRLPTDGGAGDEVGAAVGDDATAAIVFTSGSTGPPKGVTYRHPNFMAQVAALRGTYGLGPTDVHLATFPPFALFGPALAMPTVIPRMDFTRPADVHPPEIAEAVRVFGVTVMFGSPALLDALGRWYAPGGHDGHDGRGGSGGEGSADGSPLAGVRLVMSAGAPVSRRIAAATRRILDADARLATPYGATEALPVTSIDRTDTPPDPGAESPAGSLGVCVGHPVEGVDVGIMPIVDGPVAELSSADLLPPGSLGEIVVTGPVVTSGYHARPEATARAKTSWDGRFAHRMGDVGALDAAGRLWFAGRRAHLLSTPHGVVATVPVEVIFDAHPWVARSALVGIGPPGAQRACLCVERTRTDDGPDDDAVVAALTRLAASRPEARVVAAIRIHPGFPVDIRHNAKIDYGELARWWTTT